MGPYFFIEYMRRIVWLLFVLSLIEGVRIYINSKSNGLAKYTPTFSTYLITTTLGNLTIYLRKLQWKWSTLLIWQLYYGFNTRSYIFGIFDILLVMESTLQFINQRVIRGQFSSKTIKVLFINSGYWQIKSWRARIIKIIWCIWPCIRNKFSP